MERVDVAVIGAGGMGAATAWQLAKRGRSVVLLEQFEHLHRNGSSHGATRIFRMSYRDARYTELAIAALPLWHELEADSGAQLLEQSGQLDHGDADALNEIITSLRRFDLTADVMTAAQAQERWPGMRFESSVVYSPDGGRVFADRTVDAAVTSAVRMGAEFRDRTVVERIEVKGERAFVHAGGATWDAGCVVVTAGAWLPGLIGELLHLPPLTITQQQPVHVAIRPGFSFPSYLHHRNNGTVLDVVAYGLESPGAGVKVGLEGTIEAVELDDRRLDPAITRQAQEYAERWLPGADSALVSEELCLFTETQDGHFILDRVGPIVVCSPCSGHGFKFVPVLGAITADLALGIDHGRDYWLLPLADLPARN